MNSRQRQRTAKHHITSHKSILPTSFYLDYRMHTYMCPLLHIGEAVNVLAVFGENFQPLKLVQKVLRCSTEAAMTINIISIIDTVETNRHVTTGREHSWITLLVRLQALSAVLARYLRHARGRRVGWRGCR